MRKMYALFVFVLVMIVSLMSGQVATAQEDPLKMGTIVQRTDLASATGMEGILVLS